MVTALPTLRRDACDCAPFYCEENVYKLCERLVAACGDDDASSSAVYAVFVVPRGKRGATHVDDAVGGVLTAHSRSAPVDSAAHALIWDYHVFAVLSGVGARRVAYAYDLDTLLRFPTPFLEYAHATYDVAAPWDAARGGCLTPEDALLFRVVEAAELFAAFASDRRHMRAAPPDVAQPRWACIRAADTDEPYTLDRFVHAAPDVRPGRVLSWTQLLRRFG